MSELLASLLGVTIDGIKRELESQAPISEADRATLAKAAEVFAELLERKKFGA